MIAPGTPAGRALWKSADALAGRAMFAEQSGRDLVPRDRLLGQGGIGFGRYRRAVASELLFGGPAVSHERLLERLGI